MDIPKHMGREIHPLNERDDPYNRIEDFDFKAGDRLAIKGETKAVGTIVMTRYGLKLFYDGALEPVSGTRWSSLYKLGPPPPVDAKG